MLRHYGGQQWFGCVAVHFLTKKHGTLPQFREDAPAAPRIVHVFEGSSLKVVVRVPSPVVAILAHELEV